MLLEAAVICGLLVLLYSVYRYTIVCRSMQHDKTCINNDNIVYCYI